MTDLAPVLQAFFTDRLARQRHASGQTVAAYRDARLLLAFAACGVSEVCLACELRRCPASMFGGRAS